MHRLVKKAVVHHHFWESTNTLRQDESFARNGHQNNDSEDNTQARSASSASVLYFEKRHFARGLTTITRNARAVMAKNEKHERMLHRANKQRNHDEDEDEDDNDDSDSNSEEDADVESHSTSLPPNAGDPPASLQFYLSSTEVKSLQFLLEQLRRVHQDVEMIRECVAHSVTFHCYPEFQYVERMPFEEHHSCFYVLSGSLEATYEWPTFDCVQVYEPSLIYTHSTGEFIGLLDYRDPRKDMAPAATLYTKQPTQLIRISRHKFHKLVDLGWQKNFEGKMQFIANTKRLFSKLKYEEKVLVAQLLMKETVRPNKVVIQQGERSQYVHFIVSGRCQALKKIVFPTEHQDDEMIETTDNKQASPVLICSLKILESGEIFGEDNALWNKPNSVSILTKSTVVLYKIDKNEFEKVGRQFLDKLVRTHAPEYPTEESLKANCQRHKEWRNYARKELDATVLQISKEKEARIRSKSAPCHIVPQLTYACLLRQVEEDKEKPNQSSEPRSKSALPVRVHQSNTVNFKSDDQSPNVSRMQTCCEDDASSTASFHPADDSFIHSLDTSSRMIYNIFGVNTALNPQRPDMIHESDEENEKDTETSAFRDPSLLARINTKEMVERAQSAALAQKEKTEAKKRLLQRKASSAQAREDDESVGIFIRERQNTLSALYFHRYRGEFLHRRIMERKRRLQAQELQRQIEVAKAAAAGATGNVATGASTTTGSVTETTVNTRSTTSRHRRRSSTETETRQKSKKGSQNKVQKDDLIEDYFEDSINYFLERNHRQARMSTSAAPQPASAASMRRSSVMAGSAARRLLIKPQTAIGQGFGRDATKRRQSMAASIGAGGTGRSGARLSIDTIGLSSSGLIPTVRHSSFQGNKKSLLQSSASVSGAALPLSGLSKLSTNKTKSSGGGRVHFTSTKDDESVGSDI